MAGVEGRPEQSPPPPISVELGDREQYQYIPRADVSEALEGFGYGDRMKAVDAMYISPDGKIGVGVKHFRKEDYEDHFRGQEVVRGVDGAETMAQALLLLEHFNNRIPQGRVPLLRRTTVDPKFPIIPDVDVNIVVTSSQNEGEFVGHARTIIGETVVSEAIISGALVEKRALDIGIKRRQAVQARTPLLFPPQD